MKIIRIIFLLTLTIISARAQNPLQGKPTATSPAGDDWLYLGGTTNSVRKLSPLYYLPSTYLDTDGTLAANSDVKIASQKAVRTYLAATYQPLDAALTALAAGSDFVQFSGPASSTKIFTLPNASAKILTAAAAVTAAEGGTGTASYTKGDILVATNSTTLVKLPVGPDGQFITADSTQTTGIKYAAIPGGGDMLASNNLSDVASKATSRTNLIVAQTSETIATFSAAGTDTINRPTGSGQHTAFLIAGAGSGTYTRDIGLLHGNSPQEGNQIRAVVSFAASANPTVVFHDLTAGGTTLATVTNPGATACLVVVDFRYDASGVTFVLISSTQPATGTGDFSSNTSSSVDSEIVVFSGTGGKTGKRATGSGLAKLTSGVLSTVTAPSGAVVGDTDTQNLTNKTYNKVTVTAPASSSTLVIADGKTLTANQTTTLDRQASVGLPVEWGFAASDETTALTTGTKVSFHAPIGLTITSVRGELTTAQSAGSIFTFNVKKAGTSIFSTTPTIDNTETSTATAATPAVLSTTSLSADDVITITIDQIGTSGAAGLKVWILGYR